MSYHHSREINIFRSASYNTSYRLADVNDEAIVKRCAEAQPPPQAPDRRSVTENCQGWTVRVLKSLQLEGVIDEKWIVFAEEIQESV